MRSPALVWSLVLALGVGACDVFTGPSQDGDFTVVEVSPADGTVNVGVLTEVGLTFSHDLAANSVAGSLSLYSGDRPVGGVLWREGDRKVVLVPTSPLDFGTTFQIRVAPTLDDTDGTSLGEPLSFTFSTRGSPPPEPEEDQLRAFVSVLAHDSLKGRGSGTVDEARAAAYLEARFASYGLLAPATGFIQDFEAEAWSGGMVSSRNVLGTVPGTGSLAGEWIVVGAHYDHVGIRQVADGTLQIHNGADDNASGTATVVELARLFSAYVQEGGTADQPRRSVLFAAWGAEERGLLGSCSFTQSDVVPLSDIMATLNFDMVGRLRNNTVQAHGPKSAAPWRDFLADSNSPALSVLKDPSIGCASCSDHACFRDAGVPYVWFFTGTHPEYHSPADDIGLLDFEGTAGITELAMRLLTRLAVTPQALTFTPDP